MSCCLVHYHARETMSMYYLAYVLRVLYHLLSMFHLNHSYQMHHVDADFSLSPLDQLRTLAPMLPQLNRSHTYKLLNPADQHFVPTNDFDVEHMISQKVELQRFHREF